jgi:hypothetical protein
MRPFTSGEQSSEGKSDFTVR